MEGTPIENLEVELTEEGAGTAPKKPSREVLRYNSKKIQHEDSKRLQKANNRKMKSAAIAMRKRQRKPSNFVKGAE